MVKATNVLHSVWVVIIAGTSTVVVVGEQVIIISKGRPGVGEAEAGWSVLVVAPR